MKSSIFRRGRSDSAEREPLLPAIPGPSIQYEVKIAIFNAFTKCIIIPLLEYNEYY